MQKIKIEIKWALIFTFSAIAWMGVERLAGLHDSNIAMHPYVTNVFGVIAIAIYVFALLDKRNNYYHGIMSWKQGFIAGCVISIFVAILTPLSLYISLEIISPDFFNNMIGYSLEQEMYETREAAEAYFNMSNYIIQSSVFGLLVGILTSAIVSLFLKRKPKATIA